MIYSIEHIARAVKTARMDKGLSQRALSAKIGVPQSHISKIENGAVDIKVSSLIELSRALDLELMLVPRKIAPVVKGIQRTAETEKAANPMNVGETIFKDLEKIRKTAEQFTLFQKRIEETLNLASSIKELEQFQVNMNQANQIRKWLKQTQSSFDTIKNIQKTSAAIESLRKSSKFVESINHIKDMTRNFQNMRNALAHGLNEPRKTSIPAYRLDEDEIDA